MNAKELNQKMKEVEDLETKEMECKSIKMLDKMEKEYAKGNYVIAGGDFNQTFPVVDLKKYPVFDASYFVVKEIPNDFLTKDWQYAVDDSVPTSRLLNEPFNGNYNKTQLYVIDGYILSPNIELKYVKTIDINFEYTDHHPVVLEIKLKD